MAVSRYDMRKTLVLDEANAIGTASLRTRILPPAQGQQVRQLLKDYVDARPAFYDAGLDPERLRQANAATARLQEQIWSMAIAAAGQDQSSEPLGLLLESLNEVIDLSEKRQAALENSVPEVVILLLFAVSLGSLGFISYGYGLLGRRRHGSTLVFALLIGLVIWVILDLDRSRRGLIRVGQGSMIRLRETLNQGAP